MTTDLDIQLTATGDNPLVGVVMGSDSDWPTMEPAVAALAEFDIACEVGVVSAHRMPEDMVAYGRSASARGLRVIIAGAGGAAHLPGMLAALTELPVIGVPVPLKHLDGVDSCTRSSKCPQACPSRPCPSREHATPACSPPASSAQAKANAPRRCAAPCATSRRTCATWPPPRVPRLRSASHARSERYHKPLAGSSEDPTRRILSP